MAADYSRLDRWLHRIAFSSDNTQTLAFDLDQTLCRGDVSPAGPPVYVLGLARAGTSLVHQLLHGAGAFTSLSYRNMPFVLAPCLWRRLSGRFAQAGEARERAHKDGMLVDFDSAEAFEEVFWLTFCRDDFVRPDHLSAHRPDRETIERYRSFVAHVLLAEDDPAKRRYLCKNNNNVLRIPALTEAFPDRQIVIVMREPAAHAASLLRQHRNFTALHRSDPFSRQYMGWIGHFEFGLDQRPFAFDETARNMPSRSADDVDYWLERWRDVYRHVAGLANEDLIILPYEKMVADPAGSFGGLGERLGLGGQLAGLAGQTVRRAPEPAVPAASGSTLLDECRDIYRQLAG